MTDGDATPNGSSVATPAPAASAPGGAEAGPPDRRSPAFLSQLLSRLPLLVLARWNPGQALDVYEAMQGIVGLDADAFLQPLEPIAEANHE